MCLLFVWYFVSCFCFTNIIFYKLSWTNGPREAQLLTQGHRHRNIIQISCIFCPKSLGKAPSPAENMAFIRFSLFCRKKVSSKNSLWLSPEAGLLHLKITQLNSDIATGSGRSCCTATHLSFNFDVFSLFNTTCRWLQILRRSQVFYIPLETCKLISYFQDTWILSNI